MSFEADWAGLKQKATGAADTRMNLASAEDGGSWTGATKGEKSGNLKTHEAGWTAAGKSVGGLRKNLRKALTALEEGQGGLGPGGQTGDIESGAAQREVYASWKRYLEDVSGRCGTLHSRMAKAGQFHHTNDDVIRRTFTSLADKYKDTPDVGGQESRR